MASVCENSVLVTRPPSRPAHANPCPVAVNLSQYNPEIIQFALIGLFPYNDLGLQTYLTIL